MNQLLLTISDSEDKETQKLFLELEPIGKQGFLSKQQLLKILRWKSPRPLKYYEANTEEEIQEITSLAFNATSDSLKFHILTALKGVSYPAASAILMFYDRKIYPVLDIRVWQQLYQAKLVEVNLRGQNFTLKQVEMYLNTIRNLAVELNISARQVEKRLFDHDKKTRLNRLYKN